jgi:hypothetical protein
MEAKLATQLSVLESERQALKQENEQLRASLDKRPSMPAQPQVSLAPFSSSTWLFACDGIFDYKKCAGIGV